MSSSKYDRERSRLEKLPEVETDPHSDIHGVLLSDEIEFYANTYKLIEPFKRDNLKPAAYELTIGDEYFIGGEHRKLSDAPGESKIVISPFQVAVIKTAETLNLPRFLIGRWNVRVRWAYEGLLWVGASQVDPGYVGHLFCPIYNLSNKEVRLPKDEPLAAIDFVKTTPFDADRGREKWVRYPRPPERVIIEDYKADTLQSAMLTELHDKIDTFEESTNALRTRVDAFTAISFAVFAILISALSVLFSTGNEVRLGPSDWILVAVWSSVFAALMALYSVFREPGKKSLKRLLAITCGAFGIALIAAVVASGIAL